MLKLLQSIFTQAPEASAKYDEELIERATERVIDGTDPRLRALGGYRRELRQAVLKAIDHTVELVDELPPPVLFSKRRFGQNDLIRSFFVSPEHVSDFLGQCHVLQDYKQGHKGLDPEHVYALLSVKRVERKVLGMALEGNTTRRDVAQTSISFSNHRLSCPMDKPEDSLFEVKKDVFDFFIKQALSNIIAARSGDPQREEEQATLLNNKLRTMEEASWGIDALLRGEGERPVDVRRIERRIRDTETRLEQQETAPLTLDHYLELIKQTLDNTREHLWKTAVTVRMNRMGIKIEDPADEAPVTLTVDEYHSSENRSVIALPVCIPFDEIPDGRDLLTEALRYL